MHNFSIARYKGFTVNVVYVHVYILKKPLNIMHYPVFLTNAQAEVIMEPSS